MLMGTIQGVTNGGSVILLAILDKEGCSHSVYGDARLMDNFLGGVLEAAAEAGVHPTEVEVLAEGPGLVEWMAVASDQEPTEVTEVVSHAFAAGPC